MTNLTEHSQIGVWIAIGVAMGAAFDNVGMGLVIGIIIGVVLDDKANRADQSKASPETDSLS